MAKHKVEYLLATEEQKELAEQARVMLEKELQPRITELENADGGLGIYPKDVHKFLADAGYCSMAIPEEYGGLGFDAVTRGLIFEEMAKVDAGFTFTFCNTTGCFDLIENTKMPQEKKQAIADGIMAGDILGSFALTEPDAGSDAAAMRTEAKYDAATDEWVINGVKCFTSSGPIADWVAVFAWTDKTQRAGKGVSAFYVETNTPGFSVGKKENKMGLHLSETSEIVLDDVRVPSEQMIGEPGTGFRTALATINKEGRALGVTFNLGLAQAALDEAIEYAKVRRQFGKRIIDHQGIGFMIADMKARTDACRAFEYYVLNCIDKGFEPGTMPGELKMFTSDNTMKTCSDAVQVLGGYGYMKDYPTEKYMRDAKIFQIFSGTNQIQRKNIAKAIAGRDPEKKK